METIAGWFSGLGTASELPAATTSLGLAAEEGANLGTLGAIGADTAGTGVSLGSASSFFPAVVNALDTGNKVLGGVNAVKSALTPASDKAASSAPSTPATAPSTIEDYTNSERARYQQLFAGTGQGLPGGALPDDIQQMIQRNASLLR